VKHKLVGLMVGLLLAGSAQAHHSFAAEYDSNPKTMLNMTGTISKVDWTNPHVYVHVDVQDAGGKVTTWSFEGYPPNTLKRTGFPRSILKVGEKISVTAYSSKDGSNTGAGREVTFADGSKKFLGPVGR
jgi:hypothetical protein